MTTFQTVVVAVSLLGCAGGVLWMLHDLNNQVNAYREVMKQAEDESTLGLVEDDEE